MSLTHCPPSIPSLHGKCYSTSTVTAGWSSLVAMVTVVVCSRDNDNSQLNTLVPELFCHKFDLLEIVGFLCTFLQRAVR